MGVTSSLPLTSSFREFLTSPYPGLLPSSHPVNNGVFPSDSYTTVYVCPTLKWEVGERIEIRSWIPPVFDPRFR